MPKRLASKLLLNSRTFDVRRDTILLENNQTIERDIIAHFPVAVVLPFQSPDQFYLVKQYRAPIDSFLLEAPAGMSEPEENPLEGAKRELSEETGFTAKEWIALSSAYSAPGFTDELLHFFIAKDLTQGPTHPDEDEFIELRSFSISQIDELIYSQKIRDIKTLLCLFYLKKFAG